MRSGRQGQPQTSKLDPHEGFILGLIEVNRDIALAEIAKRLGEEHGISTYPATIWNFPDKRGMTL